MTGLISLWAIDHRMGWCQCAGSQELQMLRDRQLAGLLRRAKRLVGIDYYPCGGILRLGVTPHVKTGAIPLASGCHAQGDGTNFLRRQGDGCLPVGGMWKTYFDMNHHGITTSQTRSAYWSGTGANRVRGSGGNGAALRWTDRKS